MTELLLVFGLIVFNGLFSMAEMALVSSRRARLAERAKAGDDGARVALALAGAPDRFLSTVQIGITLIGILAGSVGGASLAEPLALWVATLPQLAPWLPGVGELAEHAEGVAMAVVVGAITYFSLVIGELIPKRLALGHPEAIASAVARPMGWVSRLAAPAVSLLELSTRGLLRLFRVRDLGAAPVTLEELRHLVAEGTRAGVVASGQALLLRNVLALRERSVITAMTPRLDIRWLDAEAGIDELRRQVAGQPYSRFPLCRGQLDEVVGILKVRDLLTAADGSDLAQLVRQPLFVPETIDLMAALEAFRRADTHVALVLDEYGAVAGLLTTNDVLEAIAGELTLAGAQAHPADVELGTGTWEVDGTASLDDLRERVPLPLLADEDRGVYHTVTGLLMAELGRLPQVGDQVEVAGFTFEVLSLRGHRADRVRVGTVAELAQARAS
jgi:putative hemolysin